jgi:hypothetical protein
MMHISDDHDALLDYLYEEGDPAERLKIARHLQECAACSVAVLELQTVRGMLTEWKPPSAQLGFRIVRETPASDEPAPAGVSQAPASHWWNLSNRWARAAAAVLLFAAGMAASQMRVNYTDGALTVSTPSARPANTVRADWIHLPPESRTSAESGLTRAFADTSPASSDSYEQLLQRVRAMIDQSEARQQRELALRLSQVANEVETQHRAVCSACSRPSASSRWRPVRRSINSSNRSWIIWCGLRGCHDEGLRVAAACAAGGARVRRRRRRRRLLAGPDSDAARDRALEVLENAVRYGAQMLDQRLQASTANMVMLAGRRAPADSVWMTTVWSSTWSFRRCAAAWCGAWSSWSAPTRGGSGGRGRDDSGVGDRAGNLS